MVSKFERKYGRYAIKNLTLYLMIGYVFGYMVNYIAPTVYDYLTLNPYLIMHGQIWRLVTWVLTMPEQLSIFTIIMLFLYYSLGNSLENAWGAYRYNVYIFSGLIFTVIGSIILYVVLGLMYASGVQEAWLALGNNIGACVSTYYINMSIFLAFAFTYPDMELMLYFIIPVKVKWFGLLYSAFILIDIVQAFRQYSFIQAIIIVTLIVVSLLNFLIYFLTSRKKLKYRPSQMKRKREYHKNVNMGKQAHKEKVYSNGARHKCAVCGRTELDDPNLTFRYCSKCSGNKEYCQDHLFTHTHN